MTKLLQWVVVTGTVAVIWGVVLSQYWFALTKNQEIQVLLVSHPRPSRLAVYRVHVVGHETSGTSVEKIVEIRSQCINNVDSLENARRLTPFSCFENQMGFDGKLYSPEVASPAYSEFCYITSSFVSVPCLPCGIVRGE